MNNILIIISYQYFNNNFNPFKTEKFLPEDGIKPDNNMFNVSNLDSPYYTPDKLISFSKELPINLCCFFHLSIINLSKKFKVSTKLLCEIKREFNVVGLTETGLKDENKMKTLCIKFLIIPTYIK